MSRESKTRFRLKNLDPSGLSGKVESPKEINSKDLHFKDFMPLDAQGKPVKDGKEGALHFHCNIGSSLDGVIQERMN